EWQGETGDIGVVPADDEKVEAFREKLEAYRRAQLKQARQSLEESDEAEEETSAPGPTVESSEPAPWKQYDGVESGRQGAADARAETETSTDEAGAEVSSDGGGEERPKTKAEKLEWLREYLGDCKRCPLWKNRTNIVFGEGDPEARLVFAGEAPGYHEDQQGRPFVGRAGELLNKMIQAMGLEREETYICNVLKSRPPDNRDPRMEEIEACLPFLEKQLAIIEPEVLVTLGRPATQNLLEIDKPLGAMRGRWHEYRGIDTMPTYHPAYLLRNPEQKRKTWSDLQRVMEKLGLDA
ncbi:MAG: uracil-DNA glycosylase, partial [Bradymonadaceae bacterium]